ncbi:MAG: hypothetical protein LUG98_13335 [Tannerellaceae bacterium]|nr:hypothetical protein [Tannerellaceae bacterium]
MAIFYDFYKNPPREGEDGDPVLHPRPVVSDTSDSDYLARMLSVRSTFSEADFRGMMNNLVYLICEELSMSRNIYLDGLGTFSLSLESRPVKDIQEIRSPSIRIKDIHFKPAPSLKRILNQAEIRRVTHPRKSVSYTEEERHQRILAYIDQRQAINIMTVMRLNQCNHKKAKADIQKLIDKGDIRKTWPGGLPLYTRSPLNSPEGGAS